MGITHRRDGYRGLAGLLIATVVGGLLLFGLATKASAEVLAFTVSGTTGLTKPTTQCIEYPITITVPDARPFRADTTIYMDLMGTGTSNSLEWWYTYPTAGALSHTYVASLCPSDIPSYVSAPYTLEVEVRELAGGGVINRGFEVVPWTFINEPTPTPSATPTVTVTATPSATPTVTVTATPSATPTVTVTATPSPKPSPTVSAKCLKAKKQLRNADTAKQKKSARKKVQRYCN